MKKGIVFIFIILLNSIFLSGQNTDTVPISTTAKVSKGRTEVEFATYTLKGHFTHKTEMMQNPFLTYPFFQALSPY